jgi:hypothetical protein
MTDRIFNLSKTLHTWRQLVSSELNLSHPFLYQTVENYVPKITKELYASPLLQPAFGLKVGTLRNSL